MDSGGRLLASGQNLGETMDSDLNYDQGYRRGRLYYGYLGLYWLAPSIFTGTPPSPTADGTGPMVGMTLDLSSQTSIDSSKVAPNLDGYNAEETMSVIFRARGGSTPASAPIAWSRGSDPTLEETRQKYLYRSIAMNFGLEAVTGANGTTSRRNVADAALDWLLDELTVSVSGTGQQYGSTTLTANASSSTGATIVKYRWDLGGGTSIVETTTNTLNATFNQAGTRPVRVEVTDSLGHTAVASGTVTVAPFACDPRNPAHTCNGIVAVRAFIDFGCDSFFTRGTDWPLAGTTITATMPDGTTKTAVVDFNGNATFTGMTLPEGAQATLKIDAPVLPTWVQQQGSTLAPCAGATEFVLGRSNFTGFGVTYVDFRYNLGR